MDYVKSLLPSKKISCPCCNHQTTKPPAAVQSNLQSLIQNATCDQCKKKYYYMNCVCAQTIYTEKEIFFGKNIECKSCKSYQQIVPCPTCKATNLWNGNYSMGAFVNCFNCKGLFQQVACCNCKEGNYWISKGDPRTSYKFGYLIECFNCKKRFQHLNCPNCKDIQYFEKLDYVQGVLQKCTTCTKSYQHVNCPNCYYASFFKNSEFSFGKPLPCPNCKVSFYISKCTNCNEINNGIIQNILPDYTNKFSCFKCKKENTVFSCPSCKSPVDCQSIDNTCTQNKCSSCRANFFTCTCTRCKQIELCECWGGKQVHSCISCKNTAIKGLPNQPRAVVPSNFIKNREDEDVELKRAIEESIRLHKEEEFRKQADALKMLKQMNDKNPSKVNAQEKKSIQPAGKMELIPKINNQNVQPNNASKEDTLLCKICYENNINIIFKECGHANVCEKCINSMKKKECPYCQKEGSYGKIFF